MSYLFATAVVLAAALAAAAVTSAVRRRVHIDALRHHHEIGGAVFLQMGVVFAVLLAFVFNEVWGEYNTAAEAIARECGDIRVAATLAGNLPPDEAQNVRRLIIAYLNAVVTDEWPAMSQRREDSVLAETRLRELALGVARLPTATTEEQTTREQIIDFLRSAEQSRQARLFQVAAGIPSELWFMLLTFSATLVGFLFFFGIENIRSQMLFTGVFAGSLALVLVILSMLNFPFEGAMALQPTAFRDTIVRVVATR